MENNTEIKRGRRHLFAPECSRWTDAIKSSHPTYRLTSPAETGHPSIETMAPESSHPSIVTIAPESGHPSIVTMAPESSQPSIVTMAPESGHPSIVTMAPETGHPSIVTMAPETIHSSKGTSASETALPSSAPLALPTIDDRAFWEGLDPVLKEKITERGRKALDKEFPPLLISDYREFCKNGNRSRFEEKYFARRTMLTSLVLAECVEDKGIFLDKILDGIYLILEETTWCLPAHNSYIRDTPQLPLPDAARPVIDLFAAETGAILSVCETLLDSRLQAISPLIEPYISSRIRERILDPYLSFHFWWMGDGKSPMLNWTPWITQNVLLSVFGRKRGFMTAGQEAEVLSKASVSLDYFLDEYGDDGCCSEGAQYFTHAGLCLFGCMEILRLITGDDLDSLFSHPLIRNMADYIVRVYAGGGYYFNYADCSARAGHRSARDFLFALRTRSQAMAEFTASDYRNCRWDEKLLAEEENIWYHILQIKMHKPMMEYPDTGQKPTDSWFSSTGILIARDSHFSLAARAGSNGDSHNHNDVGSVILYKDEQPFLIDLGVETYTAQTFSDRRYEIWTMQSAYHNLPTFYDGEKQIQQKDGPEYAASSVNHEISDKVSQISMDLSPVYAHPGIRSYRRNVTLRKDDSVVIEDHYEGDLTCVLSLMTIVEPEIKKTGDDLFEILLPGIGIICASGVKAAGRETCPIKDPRLLKAWNHDSYRILLTIKDHVTIRIQ